MNRYILFFFFIIINLSAFSQLTSLEKELIAPSRSMNSDIDYLLEMNFRGLSSTGENLPFWLHQNQRGRISKDSNFATWLTGKTVFFLTEESIVLSGATILYHDGIGQGLIPEEVFVHYQNSWLAVTAGSKLQENYYNGLSASNENILWSLNARPLPGIKVSTVKPVFPLSEKGFGFEISWAEYLMGIDRFVQNAKLHHKSLHLVYDDGHGLQLKAGLQHFVQWGGFSPRFGQQPENLDDYFRLITGQGGGEGATWGDQVNALGNHLGSYEAKIKKNFRDFRLEIFYNTIFEDGSGRRLGNTPDGRYGIYYERENKNLIVNSIIYEFFYTHHQSHTTTGSDKYDNYFNSDYKSGWTYKNHILGAPFFTMDPDDLGVSNNKFTAHHLGIGGQLSNYFHSFPYKLLLSYARNEGTYKKPYSEEQDVFYLLYEMQLYDGVFDMGFQFGAEYNSWTSPNYGLGISLNYEIL